MLAALITMFVIGGLFTMGGIDGHVLTFTLFPVALYIHSEISVTSNLNPHEQ